MPTVTRIREGLHCIDLRFQGLSGVIAAYLLEDAGERALIEIGPGSTFDALLAGLGEIGVEPESIGKILVTHIHLDHAGAAGTFIRRFPQAHLHVHQIGAPHMIDPTKLLASASRIYGDLMGPLWGPFEPVPVGSLTALDGDDTVTVGRTALHAIYTPGHASHHVAFHDASRDDVFTGDMAGVRLQGFSYVRPPTPPPELDLELWSRSINAVRDLRPRRMFLTHFGAFGDPEPHLRALQDRLYGWRDVLRHAIDAGQDRETLVDTLRFHGERELLEETSDARSVEAYELATPYGMSVDGYLRYFRKRA